MTCSSANPEISQSPVDQQVVLMEQLVRLVALLERLAREASAPPQQVAVPLKQATKMLGMKDEGFTKSLIADGKIRSRKHGKTVLVSVKSIRQYMGDEPKR